jgi:hypothetical protein
VTYGHDTWRNTGDSCSAEQVPENAGQDLQAQSAEVGTRGTGAMCG